MIFALPRFLIRIINTIKKKLLYQQVESDFDYKILRGYFDHIYISDNLLRITGWMLHSQGPYQKINVYVNSIPCDSISAIERPDIYAHFSHIKNSIQTGFETNFLLPAIQHGESVTIKAVGVMNGHEVSEMQSIYIHDMYEQIPVPSIELIHRVDELPDKHFYVLKGAQNFHEFRSIIESHTSYNTISSMLDWGCGSGRLTSFFAEYTPIKNIWGCDIDKEAIQWCKTHIPKASFTEIAPYPPTPFDNNQFNLVISFSVFTHLTKEIQFQWLQEMNRIVKSNGMILTTIHGISAAKTVLSKTELKKVLEDGIYDTMQDTRLTGIAPDEYYRACFQTKEYVYNQWSPYFSIIDYIEQGASNYHDIVVMRKLS